MSKANIKQILTHVAKEDIYSTRKIINIPISINVNSLGNPLEVDISNGFINNIKLTIDKML